MASHKDLTIIFLTVNKVPDGWAKYHREVLEEAIGDTPIITISRKPMEWGINLIQKEEPSVNNIYKQVLRGTKVAKTPYIAIAEDDVLYHETHFMNRPSNMDTFTYNSHRWGLHTWGIPTFYWKDRISNACLIAPRELVVKSLEMRFKLYPHKQLGELGKEGGTRIPYRNTEHFYSYVGVVYLSHVNAIDHLEQTKRKRMGAIRAYDIFHWRKAEDIVKKFV